MSFVVFTRIINSVIHLQQKFTTCPSFSTKSRIKDSFSDSFYKTVRNDNVLLPVSFWHRHIKVKVRCNKIVTSFVYFLLHFQVCINSKFRNGQVLVNLRFGLKKSDHDASVNSSMRVRSLMPKFVVLRLSCPENYLTLENGDLKNCKCSKNPDALTSENMALILDQASWKLA